MSSHTHTDIVPFIIHSVWRGDYGRIKLEQSDSLGKLMIPDVWLERFADDKTLKEWDESGRFPEDLEVLGWKKIPEEYVGKRKRFHSNSSWKKGEHVIHVVNESEYSSGGDLDMSVCSNTREAIEAFLVDFQNAPALVDIQIGPEDIQETDTVQATM